MTIAHVELLHVASYTWLESNPNLQRTAPHYSPKRAPTNEDNIKRLVHELNKEIA
jgi:hypothetical protein